MTRIIAAAGFALSLTACASHPPLSEASGPYRALNPTHWSATSDDLRGPRLPVLPADSLMLTTPPASSSSASTATMETGR